MRRYLVFGFGLLLGLAGVWAGEDATTAPTTKPAPSTSSGPATRPTTAPSSQLAMRPPRLEPAWKTDLTHQFEAGDCFVRDGYMYVGSAGAQTQIVKLRLADGDVVWSYKVENSSYQPSYPVSNGKVVVFGTSCQPSRVVGLDDRTGKELWTVPTEAQNMSAACFAGDTAFIGSYDHNLYAIETTKGRLLWKRELGMLIWSRPAALGDLVLIGCYDGYLYALKQADGKIAWQVACGGGINSDIVIAGGLALLRMDDQTYTQPYKSDRADKFIVAVDIAKHKLAGKWTAGQSWNRKILIDGDHAYFFEPHRLCSLDIKTSKLEWECSPANSVLAAPVLLKDHVLLPLNRMGVEGQHGQQTVLLSKADGSIVARGESGGVGDFTFAPYAQVGNLVVLTHGLRAFNIGSSAEAAPASSTLIASTRPATQTTSQPAPSTSSRPVTQQGDSGKP